ncbi:hypothetical protein LEN26_011796 [Aphanomyces euteiches]|uniref:Uncharacterized protein n=1 Tax=Aphanomyces euteiches TaxID=100861 RepID=A0A6G0WQI8_9STRA|nr:hypothetical protein Ae201684_012706 [Aphanomyces euteiches]KAH9095693.1 hypothetical protein Ae201684P_015492 [Aphanomyces euteiches]KAH9105267.1 hypothetical protein AeMF1_018853 [Aphanomyces euteiches]KAH9119100.1 hypothetical protein LEN26_011796 [Aphanomyces euteiches]KAH9131331.1 hypothetical protein AeNC1_019709 [Aphanomyces euteiches]
MCRRVDGAASLRPPPPELPRRRHTAAIRRLLERLEMAPTSAQKLDVLALKLERILHRSLPPDTSFLTPTELDLKLRELIKRILASRNCVFLQPNNYTCTVAA